jgi:hypothetical protein
MLIAVGVQPEALSMMDAAGTGWQDRIGRNMLVIADMVSARAVPSHCRVEVFRVISDSSLLQLRELFRASDCDTQVK